MDLARRLAADLTGALGRPDVESWGARWPGAIVATAVPDPATIEGWADRRVVAASTPLATALAAAGVAVAPEVDLPLLPRPDPRLSAGRHHGGTVRCDDTVPPYGDSDALGAFLLCWGLDAPHARLTFGGGAASAGIAAAAGLGCGATPAGPAPAVAVCAGRGPCAPPFAVDALAAGVPVVGRRTPALDEVVGDAGLLVDPAEGTEELAAALAAVLADAELAAELGRRGRARADALDPAAGLAAAAGALQR